MKKLWWFILLFSTLTHAEIYKWVDSNGSVHFSDTPQRGAEKINIPEAQTFSSPPPALPSAKTVAVDNRSEKSRYRSIQIVEPENQLTIRNNQGAIAVSVQLEPDLYPGDQMQLLYDGNPLGPAQTSHLFQINNMFRGSHTISVQVINSEGKIQATSDSITVYVMRPRVNMVPNKPRL